MVLSKDGLKSYEIGVSGKFSGKSSTFEMDKPISKFTLLDTGNGVTHFMTISQDHR